MRSCNHIKSDGRPCNAPALRKHSYCFFHQQQLNRRRRDYVDRLPILEDRAAVQVGIMQVLDRLYNKTIDYKAAALMLYGLQLASTNLKQDIFARLNSEKVDRYYGNANENEAPVTTTGAPSKPAVGLGGSVALVPEAHNDRCPSSRAEGVDLGSEAGAPSKPDFGLGGSVPSVTEERHQGYPARSAESHAGQTTQLPEGRPNSPVALLGGQPYKLDPERAAELERLLSQTIPEIKACADEVLCTAGAPPTAFAVAPNSQLTTHDSQVPSSAQETKLCPVLRDPRLETRDHSQLTTHKFPHPPRRQNSAPSSRPATRDSRPLTTHNSRLTSSPHPPRRQNSAPSFATRDS